MWDIPVHIYEYMKTSIFFGRIIQCVLIVTIALAAHFVLRAFIKKIIATTRSKMSDRKANTIRTVLMSVSKYTIIFFAGSKILELFGVTPQSVLAVAGIGSVAIGFGAQSLVKDIITGLFILMEDQFGVGDIITVVDRTGTVEAIGLRTINIRSLDGSLHIIPNSEIKIVTNISNGFNRAMVDVVVPYEEDLDRVLAVLEQEMGNVFQDVQGLKARPTVLGVAAMTDNGVSIRIIADCEPREHWGVERQIRRMVKIRFEKEGVQFPYPRRVVKLRTDSEEGVR